MGCCVPQRTGETLPHAIHAAVEPGGPHQEEEVQAGGAGEVGGVSEHLAGLLE